MSDLIRENEFIKVSLIQVEDKKINKERVLDKVNEYLSNNLVSGEKYKCTGFYEFSSACIEVELVKVSDGGESYIYEDFKSDSSFYSFCENMRALIELKKFTVPYWY